MPAKPSRWLQQGVSHEPPSKMPLLRDGDVVAVTDTRQTAEKYAKRRDYLMNKDNMHSQLHTQGNEGRVLCHGHCRPDACQAGETGLRVHHEWRQEVGDRIWLE